MSAGSSPLWGKKRALARQALGVSSRGMPPSRPRRPHPRENPRVKPDPEAVKAYNSFIAEHGLFGDEQRLF